jgi:hypothetical protein
MRLINVSTIINRVLRTDRGDRARMTSVGFCDRWFGKKNVKVVSYDRVK